jgi:hypothetical protein
MFHLGHLVAPKPSKPSVQPSALRSSLRQMLDPAKIELMIIISLMTQYELDTKKNLW